MSKWGVCKDQPQVPVKVIWRLNVEIASRWSFVKIMQSFFLLFYFLAPGNQIRYLSYLLIINLIYVGFDDLYVMSGELTSKANVVILLVHYFEIKS